MNSVFLSGRLTKDVELHQTSGGKSYVRFCLAVDNNYKDANGNKSAYFINCIAWGQTAGFLAKYFTKGSKVICSGSITTSSYSDKQGATRYSTEVVVFSVEFPDKPKTDTSARPETKGKPVAPAPSMDAMDDSDFGLPF